jgi:hypothetical protein
MNEEINDVRCKEKCNSVSPMFVVMTIFVGGLYSHLNANIYENHYLPTDNL